jgi:hypothetical protein
MVERSVLPWGLVPKVVLLEHEVNSQTAQSRTAERSGRIQFVSICFAVRYAALGCPLHPYS